jgi:DNA-binding PadR family transcriptional regulator
MSYICLAWAARQRIPSSVDKLVLLQLASHVNSKTGLCNPSNALLAQECALSLRSIVGAIKSLEKLRLITVVRTSTNKKKNVNHYKLSTGVVQEVHDVVHQVHVSSAGNDKLVVQEVHINKEEEQRINKGQEQSEPVDNKAKEEARQKLKELADKLRVKGPTSPRTPFQH